MICSDKTLKGTPCSRKAQIEGRCSQHHNMYLKSHSPVSEINETNVAELHFDPNSYTFIELFAGCGGMSSGFMKAGMKPVLLNELVRDPCNTLIKNHPDCNVYCGSLLDIDYTPYIGKIDLLAGGCCCQSFSTAGLRKGFEDDRGNLMLQYIKIALTIKPKVILIENVEGLLNHEKGETFKIVQSLLTETGEYEFNWKLLNANDYGVCQRRKRVFIVCVRKDIDTKFNYPVPLEYKPVLRDILLDVPQSVGSGFAKEKTRLLSLIAPGKYYTDLPEEERNEYGKDKFDKLRRMSMDEPALTLRCGSGNHCHPSETRPFTVREFARIQSFPDTYEFCGSVTSQYKQIGNAVPVELAYHVGKSIVAVLH